MTIARCSKVAFGLRFAGGIMHRDAGGSDGNHPIGSGGTRQEPRDDAAERACFTEDDGDQERHPAKGGVAGIAAALPEVALQAE